MVASFGPGVAKLFGHLRGGADEMERGGSRRSAGAAASTSLEVHMYGWLDGWREGAYYEKRAGVE